MSRISSALFLILYLTTLIPISVEASTNVIHEDVRIVGASSFTHLGGTGIKADYSPDNKSSALAAGDLNGDGIVDLVIGSPDASTTPNGVFRPNAGVIYVLFGRNNLNAYIDTVMMATGMLAILGPSVEAHAGFSLIVADLNKDGKTDLIIGSPGAETVFVIYGSSSLADSSYIDLAGGADVVIHGITPGARFGASLAVGEITLLSGAETGVLIGAPGSSREAAGAAYLYVGSAIRLSIIGTEGSRTGTAVAITDVNGDGLGDIFIGAPDANRPMRNTPLLQQSFKTGAVYGWLSPLPSGNQDAGMAPVFFYGKDPGDRFGMTIIGGELTGDSINDLSIAAPCAQGNLVGPGLGELEAGNVYIFAGNRDPSGRKDVALNENSVRIVGVLPRGHLGFSSSLGNFNILNNDDLLPDLLTGVPQWNSNRNSGMNIVFVGGGREAVRLDKRLVFDEINFIELGAFISDQNQRREREFSFALVTGDFNGDGRGDLAVASPFASFDDQNNRHRSEAGMVQIFYGTTDVTQPPPGPVDRQIRFISSIGTSTIAGKAETVAWTRPVDAQSYDLYLSTDGGATFPVALAQGLYPNQTSLTFNVPNLCAGRAKLQIVANFTVPIQPTKDSSGEFSISTLGPVINLPLSSISKKALILIAGNIGFVSGATTLEISSDASGSSFASFDNLALISAQKIKAKGSIGGQSLASYFPDGAVRVFRIVNSACSTTVIRVRRFDSLLVAE
jgi:hypothetical protein